MLAFVLRASIILGLALCALPLLRRAPALLRRALLVAALSLSLLVPAIAALTPLAARGPTLPLPAAVRVLAESAEVGMSVPVARLSMRSPAALSWKRVALALWAFGAGVVMLRTIASHVRARRLGRGERVVAAVEVPAVVGLFAPTILLPAASRHWSEARMAAVLLHERAHIRHRDGLAQLLARMTCAVYWFDPLSWMVARRLRLECELAADESVVATGMRRSEYAEHLLAVARGALAPAASLGMASELARRMHALFAPPARPWPRPRRACLWLSSALVAAIVASSAGKPRASASSVLATIDTRIQAIIDEEALRAKQQWAALDVSIVVLDAATSSVLAMTGDAEVPRVPGSIIKPLTVAAALDQRRITAEQTFDCEGGTRRYADQVLTDGTLRRTLDLRQILALSSNVGISKVFDRMSSSGLLETLHALGFSAVPARAEPGTFEGAAVAVGAGLMATPLEVAAAYVSLIEGYYRTPTRRGVVASAERVLSPGAANVVRGMLITAVHGAEGTGRGAVIPGLRVAGKTGTSVDDAGAMFGSFVGFLPAERPRYVVFVGVYGPKENGTGGRAAAPLFARIGARL